MKRVGWWKATMGRTDKASTIKAPQPGKNRVSEDAISMLLNHFNCANLLTSASQHAAGGHILSKEDESNTSNYEEVLTSFKNLHLKLPVDRRTRLKEKKALQRKTKAVLDNKFNLSVAAVHSHKSIVWPSKLNCVSRKSDSNVIIQPSRLSLPSKYDDAVSSLNKPDGLSTTSLFNTSIHTSSSEEKSRLAATLSTQNPSLFNSSKESGDPNKASFSRLCKSDLKHSDSGSDQPTIPLSVKTQRYRSFPSNENRQNFSFSFNSNHSCSCVTNGSSYNEVGKKTNSRTCPYYEKQQHTVSSHPVCASEDSRVNNRPHSSIIQSSSLTVLASGVAPERSCSEEMRMEESNVNELASYFEDLLHIPRKMSVMAEMMYA